MRKLPLGIQSFTKIIENDCIYIDKTKHIYELIQENNLFFARPRRFGKSLLCSTLKELFSGKRELFKDLWIEKNTDYQWPIHPVIHIDLSLVARSNAEILTASLMRYLDDIAELYEIDPLQHTTPGETLKKLVIRLFKKFGSKNRVVIIIDEYDKPILDNIENIELAKQMRNILKEFYEFVKGLDDFLRFVFITGVTRISKTSIFSGTNQLTNISMDPKFAHLVGYTKEEIDVYFKQHLQDVAHKKKMSPVSGVKELSQTLGLWYNGYRFWKDQQELTRDIEGKDLARVYAPFSILNFLFTADLSNYWFESGTPSFLIKNLEQNCFPVESFNNLTANMNELLTFDLTDIPLPTLLFQTGYVTIKKHIVDQNYELEIPNYEVRDSLFKSILAVITKHKTSTISSHLRNIRSTLENGKIEDFISNVKEFYTNIPYTIAIDKEKYYQSIFFLLLQVIKLKPAVETATNIGRIDLTVETEKNFYIFEFKLNGSAEEALNQILTMKYYEPYKNCGKKIKLIGINFSSKAKNITDYLFQDFN
ncbi:MAG: ATP-binding protein [Epsilonproteobacteria bacterium]|nr:ATP-binding protein [Campylobacterota bacterium]